MSPAQTDNPTTMAASKPPATKPPAASTPAPRARVDTPSVVQPSRSLAGHDRFLVFRPFGAVRPADFELGLLLDRKADSRLGPLLDGLTRAFTGKTLKSAAFSTQALMLAELLYNPDLVSAPEVTHVRFSEASRVSGAVYTLGIRLFSETGFAQGLAILGTDNDDALIVEHIDLDLMGLGSKTRRTLPWDPYGYSRNLFD